MEGDIIHHVAFVVIALHQCIPFATCLHPLVFYAADACSIAQHANAFSGGASSYQHFTVIYPLGGEHLPATVCCLRCDDAAHALFAIALINPRLSVKPSFSMPWHLNLRIDCHQ
jgi:hypothetical protein